MTRPHLRPLVSILAVLVWCAGCTDSPIAGLRMPEQRTWHGSLNVLALVAQLVDSAFMRPLLEQAVLPDAVDQLAAALGPLATAPTVDHLRTAEELLMKTRTEFMYPQALASAGGRAATVSDAVPDPDSAIIRDVLALVLGDALETIRTAETGS